MYKNNISGIYCIENKLDHKKYIGQSINIYSRWSKHKYELNNKKHDNFYLQESWDKNGEDCFYFYVLEECNECDLDDKERYYIELFNTLNKDYGYNFTNGGKKDFVMLDEVYTKSSNSLKDTYLNTDLKEIRRKDALKQWSNPNIRKKICGENNGMYGKHHSEETLNKLRELGKSKKIVNKVIRSVFCVELNIVFNNAAEAARELNIHSSNILNVCKGKRQTAGGYHWRFFMENNI